MREKTGSERDGRRGQKEKRREGGGAENAINEGRTSSPFREALAPAGAPRVVQPVPPPPCATWYAPARCRRYLNPGAFKHGCLCTEKRPHSGSGWQKERGSERHREKSRGKEKNPGEKEQAVKNKRTEKRGIESILGDREPGKQSSCGGTAESRRERREAQRTLAVCAGRKTDRTEQDWGEED